MQSSRAGWRFREGNSSYSGPTPQSLGVCAAFFCDQARSNWHPVTSATQFYCPKLYNGAVRITSWCQRKPDFDVLKHLSLDRLLSLYRSPRCVPISSISSIWIVEVISAQWFSCLFFFFLLQSGYLNLGLSSRTRPIHGKLSLTQPLHRTWSLSAHWGRSVVSRLCSHRALSSSSC